MQFRMQNGVRSILHCHFMTHILLGLLPGNLFEQFLGLLGQRQVIGET